MKHCININGINKDLGLWVQDVMAEATGNPDMANELARVLSSKEITLDTKIECINQNPNLLCWAARFAEAGNPDMASALAHILQQLIANPAHAVDRIKKIKVWIDNKPEVLCQAAEAAANGNPAMADALASILQLIANPTHAVDATNATDGIQKIKAWIYVKPEVLCQAAEAAGKGNPAMMNALALVFSSNEITLDTKIGCIRKYPFVLAWATYAAATGNPDMANALAQVFSFKDGGKLGTLDVINLDEKKEWIDENPDLLYWAAKAAEKGYSAMADALVPMLLLFKNVPNTTRERSDDIQRIQSWVDNEPTALCQAARAATQDNPAMADALAQVFSLGDIPLAMKTGWIRANPDLLCQAAIAAAEGCPAMADALADILQLIANPTHATNGIQKIQAMIDEKPEVLCQAVEAANKGNPAMMNALAQFFLSDDIYQCTKKKMVNDAYEDYVNSAVRALKYNKKSQTLIQLSIAAAVGVDKEERDDNPYYFFKSELDHCFDTVLTSGLGIIGMDRMETEYMSSAQHVYDEKPGLVCS